MPAARSQLNRIPLAGQHNPELRVGVRMPRSVLVGGALILVGMALLEVNRFRLQDAADASICASFYSHAATAADTARIDLRYPSEARGGHNEDSAPGLTCGALRRGGRIR